MFTAYMHAQPHINPLVTGGVLLQLVLLISAHLPVLAAIGYPSPCGGPTVPNDIGPGRETTSVGPSPTVAFLLTSGIPSSQPGLLGFQRTVGRSVEFSR